MKNRTKNKGNLLRKLDRFVFFNCLRKTNANYQGFKSTPLHSQINNRIYSVLFCFYWLSDTSIKHFLSLNWLSLWSTIKPSPHTSEAIEVVSLLKRRDRLPDRRSWDRSPYCAISHILKTQKRDTHSNTELSKCNFECVCSFGWNSCKKHM